MSDDGRSTTPRYKKFLDSRLQLKALEKIALKLERISDGLHRDEESIFHDEFSVKNWRRKVLKLEMAKHESLMTLVEINLEV